MFDTVMIVDDLQMNIKDILKEDLSDIRYIELKHGDHRFNEFIFNEIQLCILHIVNKSDFHTFTEIKERFQLIDVPIIICSSSFDATIMEEALKIGAYEYLTIPSKGELACKIFSMKVKHAIEFRKRYAEITYLSYHDELTDLYNKRFFEEEINRLDTERQLPISIIVGDVNGLKMTNDVFGHYMGDYILLEISKIIKNACRKEDIIARWGGDEFYILLPNTPHKLANEICKRIHSSCVSNKTTKIPLSISMGYWTKQDSKDNIFNVVQRAEEKMYKNKISQSRLCYQQMLTYFKKLVLDINPELFAYMVKSSLLNEMGDTFHLSKEEFDVLELLISYIDIGYITIEESIINKNGKLNNKEWNEVKRHTEIGYRIAKASPELNGIADFILYHHERWDGRGYPHGLKGEEIPKLSRIISILNAYEAMTHTRPYRKEKEHDEIIKELQKGAGTQFDPTLVNKFINAITTATA